MATTYTPQLSLAKWVSGSDFYNHTDLVNNWNTIDTQLLKKTWVKAGDEASYVVFLAPSAASAIITTETTQLQTYPLYTVYGNGSTTWSGGVSTADTNLYRASAALIKTDGSFVAAQNVTASGNLYGYNGYIANYFQTVGASATNYVNTSTLNVGGLATTGALSTGNATATSGTVTTLNTATLNAGTASISNGATITGNAYISGQATAASLSVGPITSTGNIVTTGNATATNLTVNGTAGFGGFVSMGNGLTVAGTVTAASANITSGTVGTLYVNNLYATNSTSTSSSGAISTNQVTINGNPGALSVSGISTLGISTVTYLTVSSSLTTNGGANFTSGATANALTVNGNANISGQATAATLITGAITNTSLIVNGTAAITGSANIGAIGFSGGTAYNVAQINDNGNGILVNTGTLTFNGVLNGLKLGNGMNANSQTISSIGSLTGSNLSITGGTLTTTQVNGTNINNGVINGVTISSSGISGVTSGGISVTGNSTITGTLGGISTLTASSISGNGYSVDSSGNGSFTGLTVSNTISGSINGNSNGLSGNPTINISGLNVNGATGGGPTGSSQTGFNSNGDLTCRFLYTYQAINFFATGNQSGAYTKGAINITHDNDSIAWPSGYISKTGGVFPSSKYQKDTVSELNKEEILLKLDRLPIQHWTWKDPETRGAGWVHVGPYAEDFNEIVYDRTEDFEDFSRINQNELLYFMTATVKSLYEEVKQLKEKLGE